MTKVILATFFLVFTSNAISQAITVTNTFVDGETATAAEVNQNFNDVVIGVNAIVQTDAQDNTATGYQALFSLLTTEASVTEIGDLTFPTTGISNTAMGYQALRANNEGDGNTASGYRALFTNTTGNNNTANGHSALKGNTTGVSNTASGWAALAENTTGSNNTAIGQFALFENTTGEKNTASGERALHYNTTGSFNTAIGYRADCVGYCANATAIGYNAKVNDSNKVRIGNADVTVIEGQVAFSASSDARLKEDITVVDAGLALINDLNPVSYHRINSSSDDIEMGLLAQEVEEVLAAHGLSNSGMVHQASEDAYRSVRYNDLFAPVIRAVQELDEKNNELKEQLKSQQEELLAVVQSQQEQMAIQQKQIAQLQRVVEHQFAAR